MDARRVARGNRGPRRAGRVRDSAGGAARRRSGQGGRRRLPRVSHPRRHAALRVHRVGRRARHHGRGGRPGVPMAFGVLTTNTVEEALERAGEGSDEQRTGSGDRRNRDGAAVPRHRLTACRSASRSAVGRARRRCRCSTSGRSAALSIDDAVGAYWRVRRRRADRRRGPRVCRDVWRAGRAPRRSRSGSAHRGERRQLAARSDGRRRSTDPPAGGSRVPARADTPPKVVINEAVELARTLQHGRSAAFVNGVLDGDPEEARQTGPQ